MTPPSLMEIHALHAAAEAALATGLLQHLAERPASAVDAAKALGIHPIGAARVLDVLKTAGLIEDRAGQLSVSEALAMELAGPGGVADESSRVWKGTLAFLRTGETLSSGDSVERAMSYPGVVDRLAAAFEQAADRFARALAPTLPDMAEILDVGAGSGGWTLSLLEQRADVHLTALDFDSVLERFRMAADRRKLRGRVDTIAGDYFLLELPKEGFQLIVLANVLHLETPRRARELLSRCAVALKPGGRLAIVDAFPEDEDGAARMHAAYALHLGLRLPGAFPHHEADVRAWLAEIGLPRIDRIPLGDAPSLLATLLAAG